MLMLLPPFKGEYLMITGSYFNVIASGQHKVVDVLLEWGKYYQVNIPIISPYLSNDI